MNRYKNLLLFVFLLFFARTAEGAQARVMHKPLLMITSCHHGDHWDDSVTQGVSAFVSKSLLTSWNRV